MTSTSAALRRAIAVLAVVLLLGASGCTNSYQPPTVAAPRPAGAQQPAPTPSPIDAPECDARRSVQPLATAPSKYVTQGYIRAGVDQTMTRMTYRHPATGEFQGFDIDLLYEIAKALFPGKDPKQTVRFVVVTSAERQARLRDDTVDIVADSMTATCARALEVAFSTDYLDSGQTVLVRGDSPYQGIGDLGGKPVCAATGTTSLQHTRDRPEKPIPVSVPNWTDCLVMLQQRQVEAISTDHNVLLGLRDLDPSTRFVTQPPGWRPPGDTSCDWHVEPKSACTWFSDEPHAIATRQDDIALLRFVNHVLEQLRRDGRWAQMHQKWLPEHPDAGPPPARYGPNLFWPPGM
ncbi:polar amino acid transport system substrate-binding protein [Micromonospora pisi]|uniref:Polar amino acid transport system substrate-binding protein n=1 Tax=Micromonospora pisi TaxID=589240 RepID=A0A495JJC2_9ACTN|nr:transporter substrate-binding domain-containing protein [Micromonospora pisi]RKR88668.1 polar amino acid transport system substrate-binding protein [Micromonospora pisi]